MNKRVTSVATILILAAALAVVFFSLSSLPTVTPQIVSPTATPTFEPLPPTFVPTTPTIFEITPTIVTVTPR
jgi:hypothetical protein